VDQVTSESRIDRRGFASMDKGRQRETSSQGGRKAHQIGKAHQWTTEEASAAGRKSGEARAKRKQAENAEPAA
jgi:general stress protein YciG